MKLKYLLSIIILSGFLNVNLTASELKLLSDIQFEERLRSFSEACGVGLEDDLSDECLKATQLEMASLKLKMDKDSQNYLETQTTGKKKKKLRSQSENSFIKKEIRPLNFDTDLYFLIRTDINSLNKEEVLDFKGKLQTRIKAADEVISAGNFLPKDILSTVNTINGLLNKVEKNLVCLEKKAKQENQREQELAQRIAKWQPKLNILLDNMRRLSTENSVLNSSVKTHEKTLKIFAQWKDLNCRFDSLETQIPELITNQNDDCKKLIKDFKVNCKKIDSLFNPDAQMRENIKGFISILHDTNSFCLMYEEGKKAYLSNYTKMTYEEFRLFQGQIKNNIIYLDKKIDKLKKGLSPFNGANYHKEQIENIISYMENTKNSVFDFLDDEIKRNYFDEETSEKSLERCIKEDFYVGRAEVTSFKESVAKYFDCDSDFLMSQFFFNEFKYLGANAYTIILGKIKYLDYKINKKVSRNSLVVLQETGIDSFKNSFKDNTEAIVGSVSEAESKKTFDDAKVAECYTELECPTDFNDDSSDAGSGDDFSRFTDIEPVDWIEVSASIEKTFKNKN